MEDRGWGWSLHANRNCSLSVARMESCGRNWDVRSYGRRRDVLGDLRRSDFCAVSAIPTQCEYLLAREVCVMMRTTYRPGDFLRDCDRCGFTVYASETRKQWDGLIVCAIGCFEERHPQDFVRGRVDRQNVPDP